VLEAYETHEIERTDLSADGGAAAAEPTETVEA